MNMRTLLSTLGLCVMAAGAAAAADWPTYRGDYSRGGVSAESLPPTLSQVWTWKSPHAPQPAWGGEAKADLYNKVYDMPHRQHFDNVFQVVMAEGNLYFGSSADDKLYCLDAATGKEKWTFYTEGPVRLAPSFAGGRVFVGSDDGHVYCLDSGSGAMIWKKSPAPRDYRIPGNGRVISAWPVRGSLVVMDGTVYGTAGMFPSEGVYLFALDAASGAEKWKQEQRDLPAQGYLLASPTRLYVPTGRNNPIICDRADGKRLRVVSGGGGTYALLAGEALVFGPGKGGQLGFVPEGSADQLASFAGIHMIVTPSRSFLHSPTELSALDREKYLSLAEERKGVAAEQGRMAKKLRDGGKKLPAEEASELRKSLVDLGLRMDALSRGMEECVLWKKPCGHPFDLILAGSQLFAGGEDEVAAYDTTTGEKSWSAPVDGRAFGLAVANGMLVATTDTGSLHGFAAARKLSSNLQTFQP